MFGNAAEYNDTNFMPRKAAKEVLQDYHKYIQYKGNDLILDVGSGSGNVISEIYLPYVPHSNFRLVGVDILKRMVDFANDNNNDTRLTFRVLDITEKEQELIKKVFTKEELKLGFNLVLSFFCLHWTQDYFQCYRNIFTLMRPGGQVFTLNMAHSTFTEIYHCTHKLAKWQQYLKDVPVFTVPYHDSKDPIKDCTDLLKKIGFVDIKCFIDVKPMIPNRTLQEQLRKVIPYLDPYIHVIPQAFRSEYIEDVLQVYEEMNKKKPGLPYDRLVVIATKPLK